MIGAGKRNQRVRCLKPSASRAADGSAVRDYVDAAHVWGEVRDLAGREFEQATQVIAEATVRVTILWRAEMAPCRRLIATGPMATPRTFEGLHVADQDGRVRELVLLCKELSSNA